MKIGDAAARSGVPAKTIRYYEDIGLIGAASRTGAGYRDYSDREVEVLRFLKRARDLGFPVETCRALLSLYEDRDRASADVKRVAKSHIAEIDRKLVELRSIRATLADLVERCHGDDRPDCPILKDLAGSDA